jgi:hypothetical protein
MKNFRFLLRKLLTPITFMVIPHENFKSLKIKIPALGVLLTLLLSAIGAFHILFLALNGITNQSLIV